MMKCFIANNQKHFYEQILVRKDVFIIEQNVPIEEEFDHHDSDAIQFVAYNNDKVIGAARFRVSNGKGKVERVCVIKNYRKSGVGKLIMTTILEYVINNTNLTQLILDAQLTAIPFYKKLGYIDYGDVFLDANIKHKAMYKNIR